MKRRPVQVLAVTLAAVALVAAGCGRGQPAQTQADTPAAADSSQAGEPKPAPAVRVVASFYPLYYFARQVGGERVDVTSLVPTGVEPHDWEPTASDVKALNRAQVFVYNGAGFEPWVEKVLGSLENPKLIAVDTSHGLELLEAGEDPHGHAHDAAGDHRDEHPHAEGSGKGEGGADHADGHAGAPDPHIWLDPVYNQHQVQRIADALAQADPAGKDVYAANARALIEKLKALDKEYQTLAACPRKEIVISHAFFAYPARRYGLEQIPIIAGLSPNAEPTPKQIAELVRLVKEHNIRYIFFETLVSNKVAEVIARETGARALVLNPIEGLTPEEAAKGKDFLTLMQENLSNLKLALECSR